MPAASDARPGARSAAAVVAEDAGAGFSIGAGCVAAAAQASFRRVQSGGRSPWRKPLLMWLSKDLIGGQNGARFAAAQERGHAGSGPVAPSHRD
jgi:hypothetical protein